MTATPLSPDDVSLLGYLREHGQADAGALATISYRNTDDVLRHLNDLKHRGLIRSFEAPNEKNKMTTYFDVVD